VFTRAKVDMASAVAVKILDGAKLVAAKSVNKRRASTADTYMLL
jgi:hypothetical protein